MTSEERPQVSARWDEWRAQVDLDEYAERWDRLEAEGVATHGEADLVRSFSPSSVLDAGCGMGRVGIELARHGIDVVGVDLDPDLLAYARERAPTLRWECADLASLDLGRRFEVVVQAGNVLPFCRPEDRAPAVAGCAAHLAPGGRLVAGFMLEAPQAGIDLATYDAACSAAGLVLEHRWATWTCEAYAGGTYAVSVHRRR